jgi:hypothetical protein
MFDIQREKRGYLNCVSNVVFSFTFFSHVTIIFLPGSSLSSFHFVRQKVGKQIEKKNHDNDTLFKPYRLSLHPNTCSGWLSRRTNNMQIEILGTRAALIHMTNNQRV